MSDSWMRAWCTATDATPAEPHHPSAPLQSRGVVVIPGTTVTYSGRDRQTDFSYGGFVGGRVDSVIMRILDGLPAAIAEIGATSVSEIVGTLVMPEPAKK